MKNQRSTRLGLGILGVSIALFGVTSMQQNNRQSVQLEQQKLQIAKLQESLSNLQQDHLEQTKELRNLRSSLVAHQTFERHQTATTLALHDLTQQNEQTKLSVARLDESTQQKHHRLVHTQQAQSQTINSIKQDLQRLETQSKLQRSRTERKRCLDLMSVGVRINAKSEVGSGVIVYNDRPENKDQIETYIVTAFHVVRENIASANTGETPTEVELYKNGSAEQSVFARVVAVAPEQDLALLKVTSEIITPCAKVASDKALAATPLFSKVVAVGCPLGYEPIPTFGQVTSKNKIFDSQKFWMINAPTIFGNSGGGVFDMDSGQLTGILIRIAAYKNVIDVAVPHLGIVTPMSDVREWLKTTPYSFVLGPKKRTLDPQTLTAGQPKPSSR